MISYQIDTKSILFIETDDATKIGEVDVLIIEP